MKMKIPKPLRRALITSLFWLLILFFTQFYQSATYVPLPIEDGQILLYSNQTRDDLTQTYTKAIDSAESSILLMIYGLTEKSLIDTLKKRASEGIKVTVICDPEASKGLKKKLGKDIKTYYRNDKGIMHLKVLVIDQIKVWLGSANLTHSSLKIHGNLVMSLHHSSLAKRLKNRAERIMDKQEVDLHLPHLFKIGKQNFELWILPSQPALYRLIDLIKSAEKSVKVAMFTWTHPKLTEVIIQAHQRGVKVEVVMDYNSSQGASIHAFDGLIEAGVPTLLSHCAGLLHHKMLLVDEHTLVNGSANWTRSAFTQNDDCFMIINQLTSVQNKQLSTLWRVITAETIRP